MSERQETITADAPDAAEAAAWADLEKDVADEGEEPEAEAEGDAEPAKEEPPADEKAEPEKAAEKPLPYEELDKRHKQLQGALGEERNMRRQAAERAQQMEQVLRQVVAERKAAAEQQQAPKVPTLDEDPIGFFQHKIAEQERVIEELRTGSKQTVEQFQRAQHEQRFWGEVQRSEQEMRSANPDYDPAVTFLEESRVKELELMIPDTAQAYAEQQGYNSPADLRAAVLNNDRITIARQALQMQMSPAELYYKIAHQRGYQPKAAAPPVLKKATAQANPISATKAGMQASKSLSGGGGGSNNVMSAEDLAQLYLEDPDRADKEFARMKKAGLLG